MNFAFLIKTNRKLIALAVLLSLMTTAVTLLQPVYVGDLLSAAGSGEFTVPLLRLLAVMVGAAVLSGLTMFFASLAADKAVRELRQRLSRHLMALTVGECEKRGAGGFVTRITSDTTIVSTAFSSALVDAIGGITIVIGAVIYMAIVDLVLLLVVIVVVGVSIGIIAAASSRIGTLSQIVQDHLSHLGEIFQNSLNVIRTIKSLRAERIIVALLDQEITSSYQARKKMNIVEAILMPLSTLTGYVALIAVLVVGAVRVSSGAISGEELVIFATALFIVMAPIGQISVSFASFFEAKGAMVRIRELFSLSVEDVQLVTGSVDKQKSALPIEFRDVHYGFRDARVLTNASFHVCAGENVALMGSSGSGKSTILSLLLRFYDPVSGTILIDGAPIADWSLFQLRSTVAYVEQEPNLLPGTLKDNLLLGVSEPPTDAELIDLLREFALSDFASSAGLLHKVGAANSGVSGGERQRIAIIRAIIQKAPIIVVDEPTSALDTNTAATVMSLLLKAPATLLFSSHDQQITQMADRVLHVTSGRVVPEN